MPFMPFNILGLWLRGLLSVAVIAGGVYLLKRWFDEAHVLVPAYASTTAGSAAGGGGVRERDDAAPTESRRVFRFTPGRNRETAYLAAGVALVIWAVGGRWIGEGLFMLTLRAGTGAGRPAKAVQPGEAGAPGECKKLRREKARKLRASPPRGVAPEADDDPRPERTGEVHMVRRPDGSVLRVECYGPADAPPVVMTHGWGADSTAWFYPKRHLAGRFRLILWDEPGLGLSRKPDDNDYRLEKLAADLEAVLAFAGRPAVLVGHSIGGMITLTFCRAFPEALGTRVAGLVLAHTSYTNPVRTTRMAGLYTALEKPVLVPLLYLTIGLWPLAWAMNWLSWLNGSAQRSTHGSSFSGNETRGQLGFVARFMPRARPDVLARGMLGMLAYDATGVLSGIGVPTLVVVGDGDTTTLPEAGGFIARSVPDGRLVSLSPAKHMGLIEHHDRFDRLVAGFAESCQKAEVTR